LGVTCLHLLTNINPFDLFSTAENDWVWREYLIANNPISDKLGKVLDKLVQQAVKKRYQSVDEVLADLNPGSNQVKPSWSESTSTPPPPVDPKYRQENIQPTTTPSQDFDKLMQNLDNTWKGVQPPPPSREKITPVDPPSIKATPKNNGTLITFRFIAGFFAIPFLLSLSYESMGTFIFIGLIGGICASIAQNKKRDFWLWFFLGCLFSFFALILISVLPASI
jgi:serine/threonine protein kinase